MLVVNLLGIEFKKYKEMLPSQSPGGKCGDMANHKARQETDNGPDGDTRSINEARAQFGLHEKRNDPWMHSYIKTCPSNVQLPNIKNPIPTLALQQGYTKADSSCSPDLASINISKH